MVVVPPSWRHHTARQSEWRTTRFIEDHVFKAREYKNSVISYCSAKFDVPCCNHWTKALLRFYRRPNLLARNKSFETRSDQSNQIRFIANTTYNQVSPQRRRNDMSRLFRTCTYSHADQWVRDQDSLLVSYSNHSPEIHRQRHGTDRQTDKLQHCLMPSMWAGNNKEANKRRNDMLPLMSILVFFSC